MNSEPSNMRSVDVMKELFLDYNLSNLLDLHQHIQNHFDQYGFMNTSKSYEFINCLLDNMYIVNTNVPIVYGNAYETTDGEH